MYQKLVIIGNLGRDPEMRYMPDGRPVTQLNVATNNVYKDANGQQVKETTWFRVTTVVLLLGLFAGSVWLLLRPSEDAVPAAHQTAWESPAPESG